MIDIEESNLEEKDKVILNSNRSVEEEMYSINSFADYYNQITFTIDDEYYFYPSGFKQVVRNPGENSYALCDLAEKLYNTFGYYSNEIINITSGVDLISYVSPLDISEKYTNRKDEYNDFLEEVEIDSVAEDVLLDSYKYGMYFGYLEYTNKDGEKTNPRIISLNPKYMKILGNDGKTISIGVDLYSVIGKRKEALFPPSLRRRIKSAKKNILKGKELTPVGGVINDENIIHFKHKYVKIDVNRSVTIINGDTKRATWGQIPFINAIDSMITYLKLEPRFRQAIDSGGKNIITQVLPGNEKASASTRSRTVKLGNKSANQQHDSIKKASSDTTSNNGALSLEPGTKIEVLSLNDIFNSFTSTDNISRITFDSGIPFEVITGKAEGKSIENYTKKVLNNAHRNLSKFAREIDKVFRGLMKDEKKVVTLSYIKLNDYIRVDVLSAGSKLFVEAGGSYEAYIASGGFTPRKYLGNMNEERAKGYDDIYLPHLTANNISSDDDNVSGRDSKAKEKEKNNKDGK